MRVAQMCILRPHIIFGWKSPKSRKLEEYFPALVELRIIHPQLSFVQYEAMAYSFRGSHESSHVRKHNRPMQITKQLAIFFDNLPGMLARVPDALAQDKINMYAITTSDTVDHSVIRLVLSDYRKAMHVFEEHGTLVVEDDVLLIEGGNKPGELAGLAHKLAKAKIN